MIDIRKLKELVRLMVNHDLTEVDLRDAEEQVTLRRHSLTAPPQLVTSHAPPIAMPMPVPHPHAPIAAAPPSAAPAAAPAAAGDEAGLKRIESPMVGTFYTKANPEAAPFVSVGGVVGPDTVVCLIEAMKIFNEIKAECSGTIVKVLVNNAQAVEFGQPLFLVKPS